MSGDRVGLIALKINIQIYKLEIKTMSKKKHTNKTEKTNLETDTTEVNSEILDMIKHPPKIDDTMSDLPLDEFKENQALVPEIFGERAGE